MKRLGMVVAVEIDTVIKKFAKIEKIENSPYEVFRADIFDATIYILKSGAGEVFASAGTQYLITKYNVEVIVNFGVVGALTEELTHESICLVEKIVHYDFDTSSIDGCAVGRYLTYESEYIPTSAKLLNIAKEVNGNLKLVTCASGDKFVADADKKRELHNKFNADIVEMEAAGIVLTCDRNNIPCIFVKAIADTLFGGAEQYKTQFNIASTMCLEIVEKIIQKLA
mgnify:FL=1